MIYIRIFKSILVLLCVLEVSGSETEMIVLLIKCIIFSSFFFGVHSMTRRRMVLVAKAIQRKDAAFVANFITRVATLAHNEFGFLPEICCLTCGVILPLMGAINIVVLHIWFLPF